MEYVIDVVPYEASVAGRRFNAGAVGGPGFAGRVCFGVPSARPVRRPNRPDARASSPPARPVGPLRALRAPGPASVRALPFPLMPAELLHEVRGGFTLTGGSGILYRYVRTYVGSLPMGTVNATKLAGISIGLSMTSTNRTSR